MFIVIDGTDGSGKATQVKLLVRRLRKNGYRVKVVDFPQYGKKSAALVEEYLNGKYGNAQEVGPYRASIFFACDRYATSFKIRRWLREGKIVVSNRYVAANMGHQGGKIKSATERKRYFQWLYDLEYRIFSIPQPNINIILHVDATAAQRLVDQKEKRHYLKGKGRDMHEDDLTHLRDAEKVYLEMAKTLPGFILIECTINGDIMEREKISDMVWDKVKKILK